MDIILLILITSASFIATNIDDIFLLAALFSHPHYSSKNIILGQYAGFITLLVISISFYFLRLAIPLEWISLLGIIPIIIGIKHLISKEDLKTQYVDQPGLNKFTSVALLTISNGGDNLGVYIPLFAGLKPLEILVTSGVFLTLTGLWCFIGFKLINNRYITPQLLSILHNILPLILILLGFSIIISGGAVSLLNL